MARIVSDPSAPADMFVLLRTGAQQPLRVRIARSVLRQALGAHDTFASMAASVRNNLALISDAALARLPSHGRQAPHEVTLSLADLQPGAATAA